MKASLFYFLKLKYHLGFRTAIGVFYQMVFRKGMIHVPFLKYPFLIRYYDTADEQIFNQVILRRCYVDIHPRKKEVRRIIDLGANIGLSAISFLAEYPNSEIAVVEPETNNFKLLKENTKPYGRAHYFNSGVYGIECELFVEDPLKGSHAFRVADIPTGSVVDKVKSITISGLLRTLGWDTVDIIKMDIEGAEKNVFLLNTEWLSKVRYLLVETHDRFVPDCTKTVFRALEPYSYRLRMFQDNLLIEFVKELDA